ncbi:G-type lectin S-receptor-like serine/threonine-protein kinase [Arachis hypogaea]|nr:G-type lectin S-receptor-like serine/threonine-protein kinase [Arachis hypogaea]
MTINLPSSLSYIPFFHPRSSILLCIFMEHYLSFLLLLLLFTFATSLDTITSSYILKSPQTLTSKHGMFHLGFFNLTTNSSSSFYLGIWYITNPPVVWVANRDQPIKGADSGAVLKISEDGNLVIMDARNNEILWSTNVSNIASPNNTSAQLLTTGNLVLQDNATGTILWQSFQHPADTLLQNMKISANRISGKKVNMTSWRTPHDPSTGDFSVSLERLSIPEVFIWRGKSQPHWRSGPWNGQIFLGIPEMTANCIDKFYTSGKDEEKNGTYYLSYSYAIRNVRMFALGADGNLNEYYWDFPKKQWSMMLSVINTECGVYGKCGVFASCDPKTSPICTCLRGYVPRNAEEWNKQNWSSGCVRKTPVQCESEKVIKNNSSDESVAVEDGFVKLQNTKVPDYAEWLSSIDFDCRTACLGNCSCKAYAYDVGIGCMLWSGNLIDIQRFSMGGTDLYIRVPSSELDEQKKKNHAAVIIAVTVSVAGTIGILICAFIMWKRRTAIGERANFRIPTISNTKYPSKVKLPELSQFEFEKLAIATDNFHLANKLGQGGFGLVYRGTLEDGLEVAVKRLSRASCQGLEEFMNEVLVISKLQHRNLVRLLGCCVEGDEKILVYEYMPNKSLDAYLFDSCKQVLNWEKRFHIIEGITRGLLYLHRDSRLRIIHRDLKPSNILLDEELNPKISDFGMARIFCHTENEANTMRVAGTYGYMSPEYAMEGLFSEKSDVFSFGVLLLEIVSRRKNTKFYEDAESLSLLGFAWKLWNADNIPPLTDPEISNLNCNEDIKRCIHIGLLCVQELARDRPTMIAVVSMLNSETVNLPSPKQEAASIRSEADSAGYRVFYDK